MDELRAMRIKRFLSQMATQDNRATAFPYFYVIRSKDKDGTMREENMFLTETDAEHHLKSNHYNYPAGAHTYIKHAFRAPELKQFLFDLCDEFGIVLDDRFR